MKKTACTHLHIYMGMSHYHINITFRMHLTCVLNVLDGILFSCHCRYSRPSKWNFLFMLSVSVLTISLVIGLQLINNEMSIVNCMGIGRQTMQHKSHRKKCYSMNDTIPMWMIFNFIVSSLISCWRMCVKMFVWKVSHACPLAFWNRAVKLCTAKPITITNNILIK